MKQLLRHRQLTDSLITLTGGVAVGVINYAFNILAARLLGPESFSEFGSVMALFYVGSVAAMTTGMYVTRAYRGRHDVPLASYFRAFLHFALLIAGLGLLASPILAWVYHLPVGYFWLLSGTFVSGMLTAVCTGILAARKQFVRQIGVNAITAVLKLVVGFGLWMSLGSILALFGGIFIAGWVMLGVAWWWVRDEHLWQPQVESSPRVIHRDFLYMAAILVGQNLIFGGDILAAHRYLPALEAGYVTALSTFAKIGFWVAVSFSGVMYAYVVNPHSDQDNPRQTLIRSIGLSLVVTGALALGLWVGGEVWLSWIFGPNYAAAAHWIVWLIPSLLFYGVFHLLVQYRLTQTGLNDVWRMFALLTLQMGLFYGWAGTIERLYAIQAMVYGLGVVLFWPRDRAVALAASANDPVANDAAAG